MKAKVKNPLLVLFLFSLFFGSESLAQAPSWGWVKGESKAWRSNGADTDAAGNIYVVAGFAQGSSIDTSGSFTGGTLLIKYDSLGALLWKKQLPVYPQAMKTDPAGNCYITGTFYDTAQLGADLLISQGNKDIVIAKLDSAGNFIWARQAGGPFNDVYDPAGVNIPKEEPFAIGFDLAGNCFVTMMVSASESAPATFDSISIFQDPDVNHKYVCVIAGYSDTGAIKWVQKVKNGFVSENTGALAISEQGDCYFTFNLYHPVVLGNSILASAGNYDVGLARINPSGEYSWARSVGGVGAEFGNDIAINSLGEIYLSGTFKGGDLQVDGVTLQSNANKYRMFLIKFDQNGNALWASQTTGAGEITGTSLAIDPAGNAYISGNQKGPISIGQDNFNASYYFTRPIIIKWNDAGEPSWVVSVPSGDYAPVSGLFLSPDHLSCYFYGIYQSDITLSDTTFTSQGSDQGFFLAKLTNIITSSTPDLSETNWSVYPNPASRVLHLKLPAAAQPVRAILTDVRGQEVFTATIPSLPEASLELPALPRGLYVISVETGREVLRKKIVIE